MAQYKVKPGDSWARIAGNVLGNQSRYKELIAANPGTSMLHPGDTIRIPSKPKNRRLAEQGTTFASETPGGRKLGRHRLPSKPKRQKASTIASETPGGRSLDSTRAPQPPKDVGAGESIAKLGQPGRRTPKYQPEVSRPDRPQPDLMEQAERMKAGAPDQRISAPADGRPITNFQGSITPADMGRNLEPEGADVQARFQEGPPQNPFQAIRAEYQSNPRFDMTQLANIFNPGGRGATRATETPGGRPLFGGATLNQQTAAQMREDMLDWENKYGDYEMDDEGDLWIAEQLGIIEPDTGEDETGFDLSIPGAGKGGLTTQRKMVAQAPRGVRRNYSSIIGLVNWRI